MGRRSSLMKLRNEEGATVIIVTLCLVALFCMLVLVVDVGGLLWKRRELVSGSDAAALAAAKTCAVPTTKDSSVPETQADTAAVANVGGLTPSNGGIIAGTETCRQPRGYVTVQYSYPQHLFFAGILGAGSRAVTTEATAAWGPLAGGRAVPIVLESSQFQGPCDVPDVTPPAACNFWYDNGSSAIGDANWGFLSLDPSQWGVAANDNNVCSNVGASTRGDWILHDSPTELALKDPSPTYVCNVTGHASSNWQDLNDRMNCAAGSSYGDGSLCPGNLLLMPVNDCAKQVDKNGVIVPCGTGTPDKYAIIGFTTLELTAVYRGDDPAAIGTAGSPAASGTCTSQQLGLDTSGQRLLNIVAMNCSGRPTIDQIPFSASQSDSPGASLDTTFKIYFETGNGSNKVRTYYRGCDVGGSTTGCDYTYNPANFAVQWVNPVTQSDGRTKLVDLKWIVNATAGTPGACGLPPSGIRPSDPNAICLETTWLGYTDQNGTVGTGPSFGVQGHVLCDFTYNSCPANVKP